MKKEQREFSEEYNDIVLKVNTSQTSSLFPYQKFNIKNLVNRNCLWQFTGIKSIICTSDISETPLNNSVAHCSLYN